MVRYTAEAVSNPTSAVFAGLACFNTTDLGRANGWNEVQWMLLVATKLNVEKQTGARVVLSARSSLTGWRKLQALDKYGVPAALKCPHSTGTYCSCRAQGTKHKKAKHKAQSIKHSTWYSIIGPR